MARMKKTIAVLFLAYSILIIITGCQKEKIETLEKEALFPVSYGKAEDELTFFHKPGMKLPDARIAMSGGILYLASNQGGKVMKFNSYGDLIGLFYNTEVNPEPVLLSSGLKEDEVSTRRAFPYPFLGIGDIAVTENHTLLVQETITKQRRELDAKLGVMLDQIVLRFDRSGNLIDFLGQEGSGGTPFPYIERISTTLSGDTVVFCRTISKWLIYWFTGSGFLKYRVEFDLRTLPVPGQLEKGLPSMGTIYTDLEEERLYVKIDYYEDKRNDPSASSGGIQYDASYIYVFDIQKEQYIKHLEIPEDYKSQNSMDLLELDSVEMIYRLIGVSRGGHLFLLAPSEGNEYELMIFTTDGKVIERVNITLNDAENIHRDFYITSDGIVCALLCEEKDAEVVWWRTDRYLGLEDEQGTIFKSKRN